MASFLLLNRFESDFVSESFAPQFLRLLKKVGFRVNLFFRSKAL